ncbi:MAG: YibE/F family protein [Nocardioides sp.]|uniref:YibE/F family protein n=1 Tax=Nocardioides sp. TaxID=35761 RepID=UPI0039E72AFD
MAHSHTDGTSEPVAVTRGPRIALLVLLAVVAVATLVGLRDLWPDRSAVAEATSRAQFAAPGVTFPKARIVSITQGCGTEDDVEEGGLSDPETLAAAGSCDLATVRVLTGDSAGRLSKVELQGPMASSGLGPGDRIELMSVPGSADTASSAVAGPLADSEAQTLDSAFGIDRNGSLAVLVVVFVALVVVVARHRGLLALVALVFSGLMLVRFVLPALVAGGPGLPIALVGSSAIMYVVLYVAHGLSLRTSVALAGTLAGIAVTAAVTQYAVASTHLSGFSDEASGVLSAMAGDIDFRGLLTCAIIVAGLGVLNDVTITQASAVWELRAAAPDAPRRDVFARAMRIGRDHIASTIYTIVFAYAGAAMSVLLLLYLYDRPALELLTQEDIATEVVRTLCSAIGLVAAMPITTAIAACLAVRARPAGPAVGGDPDPPDAHDPVFDDFWGERRSAGRPPRT